MKPHDLTFKKVSQEESNKRTFLYRADFDKFRSFLSISEQLHPTKKEKVYQIIVRDILV